MQRHAVRLALEAPLRGARAYVCGLSAMVDDVVTLLSGDGTIARDHLRYETYD